MPTSTDGTKPKVIPLLDGRRIRQVRVYIHQPKIQAEPIERVISIEELLEFAAKARAGAAKVESAVRHHKTIAVVDWNRTYLNPQPNEVECAFCKAKAVCPNAAEKVRSTIVPFGAIEDLDVLPPIKPNESKEVAAQRREITSRLVPTEMQYLDQAMLATGFIEDWVLAVRAEMERRQLAGEKSEHFGLEAGRKGARVFSDPEKAAALLRKTFRLKEKHVFNFKLKTPTQIEDLTKPSVDPETGETLPPVLGSRRWSQLRMLITQRDPKPTVRRKELIKTEYVKQITELGAVPDDEGA